MLAEFHASLRSFVYDRANIAADDVDIAFDPPVRAWVGARTRPTLSFFLFDILENTELRQTAPETVRGNGRAIRRVPPRRFDLTYLVSAISTVVEDEHLLVWRLLGTLMQHPTLPESLLPDAVRALGMPVTGRIAEPAKAPRTFDVWSALENPPRPSLIYVVTVPLDLELEVSAPLVLTRTTRYTNVESSDPAIHVRSQIGGRVRDRAGAPLVNARVTVDGRVGPFAITDGAGQFALAGLEPGRMTLRVQHESGTATLVPIVVPSDAYEIVADNP